MSPQPSHFRQERSTATRVICRGLIALLGLSVGCQAQPAGATSARVPPPKATGEIEHCAANLHDLSGYLLQYYVMNHKLPDTLGDLKPLAESELPLTCPISQQPYIYIAQGLRSNSDPRWLLIYEPVPHDGIRNAILGAEPVGNQPLGLWVIQLDNKSFSAFRQPASPVAAPDSAHSTN